MTEGRQREEVGVRGGEKEGRRKTGAGEERGLEGRKEGEGRKLLQVRC